MMYRSRTSPAFTLIELLIVIVIISILSVISIVAYNGIQNRARASEASSALTQAAKKIKVWQVENADTTPPDLATVGITNSGNVSFQYKPGTLGSYCITATSGTVSYKVTDTSQPTQGGCSGHGQGGQNAITNLVGNPKAAANATGWSVNASTGGAASGARVASITGPSGLNIGTAYRITLGGTPSTWWRAQYGNVPVSAGQSYTFSAYVRPSVTANTGVIIIWRNASNVTVSESASSFPNNNTNVWERRSVTATAPVGAVSVTLQTGATNNGASGVYIDATGFMFVTGTTLNGYADGDSVDWDWNSDGTSTGPPL